MKKLISILLILSIVLCLGACGDASTDESTTVAPTTSASADKADENTEAEELKGMALFFDADRYTAQKGEKTDVGDGTFSVNTSYALISKSELQFPKDIVLDGTDITLGVTKVDELLDMGWRMYSDISDDSTVNANSYAIFYIANSKNTVCISALNDSDSPASVYDCPVESVSFKAQNVEFDCNGLNSTSSPADVVSTLGEPTSIRITDYFDGEGKLVKSNVFITYYYEGFEADFFFYYNGTVTEARDVDFGI